jgi:3-hydroxyisobutyrate dehydrogenase
MAAQLSGRHYFLSTMKTGFIGLGAMGMGMARNLHQHGLLTAVWNRSADKATSLAQELDVHAADSLTEMAQRCDALVTCISADQDLLQVIAQLKPSLRSGTLIVDCSTVSATTARECAVQLQQVSCDFLDAPVSGGVEGARLGTLAIMVGGLPDVFERAQPVLKAMGKTITHFGSTGAGQAAKATNQILCAGNIQAAAEAMAFAKAEGLPLDKVIDTLSKGAGASWYFTHRAPNMMNDNYAGGFRVRLHEKDLKICRDMAQQHGAQLPLIEMTLIQYRRLIEQGHGDEDISTLFHLKAALFKSQTNKE